MDERVIDGIKLKGTDSVIGDVAWVDAFKIQYSLDSVNWNKVLNVDNSEKART